MPSASAYKACQEIPYKLGARPLAKDERGKWKDDLARVLDATLGVVPLRPSGLVFDLIIISFADSRTPQGGIEKNPWR